MVPNHLTSHMKPYCGQEKSLECKGMETWIKISLANLNNCCNCSCLLLLSCTMQPLQLSLDLCGSCFVTQLILDFLTSKNISGSWQIADLLLFYAIFHQHEARVVTFERRRAQYTCHSVWSFIFFQPLSNTMSIRISLFEPALLKVCLPVRHDCQFNTLHPTNRCVDHSRKQNSTVKQSNRLSYSLAVAQDYLINRYS